MKTITITAYASTRYVGSKCEDEIEVYVEDNATPEEIETACEDTAREWMLDNVEW
tara:strand:+ start:7757 stop:7921 length:165 start_codon:yes stop_codon:yes gene_type:complete